MENLKFLTKQDLISLFEIAHATRFANTSRKIQNCFQKVRSILSFDSIVGAYVDRETIDSQNKPIFFSCSLNFSKQFLQNYVKNRYYKFSPVFQTTCRTWHPQHWQSIWSQNSGANTDRCMGLAAAYGYYDGWSFAVNFPADKTFSFFAVTGKKIEKDKRTATIINYLSPYFCEALQQVFGAQLKKQKIDFRKLTARELEVLQWIEKGKSTWDISVIFNRSERVVKWHVNNIVGKLCALNRTHAVAIALRNGLIEY